MKLGSLRPQMIGISGESGVGKSTIAEIVALFFGIENTTVISTDDLHRWDRFDKNWDTLTHLNPDANNLELGDIHTRELSLGNPIYRSKYNHRTGHFNPPIKIEPRSVVVVEGLHAFYTETCKKLIDLKIFIDTDEDLRVHWKILRDTEERGYKYNVVLDTINKRKPDSDKIRSRQIMAADVIIKISPKEEIKCLGNKEEKIDLELSISFPNGKIYEDLFEFIEHYTTKLNSFIKISEEFGSDIAYCQDGGGNASVKVSSDYMLIKASGFPLKEVHKPGGYCVVNHSKILEPLSEKKIKLDHLLNDIINSSVVSKTLKKPSMETGFHAILDECVIHTHPIHLTLLLCLQNSHSIIDDLYSDLDYHYIEYTSPGLHLLENIENLSRKTIYFLENHGVIVSSDSNEVCVSLLHQLGQLSKKYVEDKSTAESFNLSFAELEIGEGILFPDAAMFLDDITKRGIRAAHNYIETVGPTLGNLRYLTTAQVSHLTSLDAEKYRKTL